MPSHKHLVLWVPLCLCLSPSLKPVICHKFCGRTTKLLLMHLICDLSADTVKIADRKSWCGSSRNCAENVEKAKGKFKIMWV